jgi:hypothetical protein
MKQRKKESLKGEPPDLDARARAAFAATAEDIDEPEERAMTQEEGVSEEGLRTYLEDVMNEVKKEERTSTKTRNVKNQV